MTATFHILTLTPIKRGRKYFTCSLPEKGYAVKLVINGLTDDIALNAPVSIRAKDLSRRSVFGSQIIYEATQLLGGDPLEFKIAQCIDRAIQKACARGLTHDLALGAPCTTWRTPVDQAQVQARWNARRAKRKDRDALCYARSLLPHGLGVSLKEPGLNGVRQALATSEELRSNMIEAAKSWLARADKLQVITARAIVGDVRNELEGRLHRLRPMTIWDHMAGVLLAAELAEEVQLALDVAHLEENTKKASAAPRRVRL